jgi:hypothetical protein
MHVRHGDKFKEMTYVQCSAPPNFPVANTARSATFISYTDRLHPIAEYLEAAARLAEEDASLSSSRIIFLSTDDAGIIDDIKRGAFDHMNFTFYYLRYGFWA